MIADAAAAFDGQRQHGRIALQSGDVVDDLGAGVDGVPSDQGLRGVDRNGQVRLPAKRPQHRHDAAEFLLHVDRLGIGPGALATDVEDVGPFGGQPQAVLDGRIGVEKASAVGEAVGRNVDDAHQQRQLVRDERAGAKFPSRGGVKVTGRHAR